MQSKNAVRTAVAAVTLILAFAAGSTARAAYDPVGSGTTRLVLDKAFASLLAQHQIRLLARGAQKEKGRAILLHASGGLVDSKLGAGTVESEGVLVFVAGHRKVLLRHVAFKAKRAPLWAKVGGGKLKLAYGAKLGFQRSGFGVAFNARGLRLTAKAATRLSKKLRLRGVFKAGQLIGTLKVQVAPATVHLENQGRLSLALDPTFFGKLNNLFVAVNPISPAELSAGPTLSFPIGLESVLAPDGSDGVIKLGGSVELLQLGNAQVFWRELWLEPGLSSLLAESDYEPSPPHAGKQPQIGLLSLLPGAQVRSNPTALTISVTGQRAVLDAATAAGLNEAFTSGSSTFFPGELVGTISFTGSAL